MDKYRTVYATSRPDAVEQLRTQLESEGVLGYSLCSLEWPTDGRIPDAVTRLDFSKGYGDDNKWSFEPHVDEYVPKRTEWPMTWKQFDSRTWLNSPLTKIKDVKNAVLAAGLLNEGDMKGLEKRSLWGVAARAELTLPREGSNGVVYLPSYFTYFTERVARVGDPDIGNYPGCPSVWAEAKPIVVGIEGDINYYFWDPCGKEVNFHTVFNRMVMLAMLNQRNDVPGYYLYASRVIYEWTISVDEERGSMRVYGRPCEKWGPYTPWSEDADDDDPHDGADPDAGRGD